MPRKKNRKKKTISSSTFSSSSPSKTKAVDNVEFYAGQHYDLGVALLPKLFNRNECELLQTTGNMEGSNEINDRHEELIFRHRVWRIEKSVDNGWKPLFDRAIQTIEQIDRLYWRQISRTKTWHPEAEYIEYVVKPTKNGKKPKTLPGISPHVDNSSVITMVAMLTPTSSYVGGKSCFEGNDNPRILTLEQGDAVFFRGEKCEHWITDVEEGKRCILQIECCRMKPGRH
jgi:hypothetical protein